MDEIASLREQKGKEKEALALIEKALSFGYGLVINLFWEEALVYQHTVMVEDAKPEEERNERKRREALRKMEEAILKGKFHVEKYKLRVWESRLHRFLGRLNDYKGDFNKSVSEYKKAIPLARLDPDFTQKGYPRWLELEGFLAYALVMSGKTEEGISLAKGTFKKFDTTREGEALAKKDYYTWAVWKSGISIRVIGALLKRGITFSRKQMVIWLAEAEKVLAYPKDAKIWGDKNFQFRKDEIASIRSRMSQV